MPPSMKPIIDTRINSAPATALGRTLLRIVFNAVQKGSNFSDVIVFPPARDGKALRQGSSMKGDFIESPYVPYLS